ncbi:mannitol-1-phosphate 5-dehydrogenase [Mesomycoplasma conjunctivae]|uniref:mannitol-1-phosphate 5-dehydrogenase n=1 Tax=Mesomycoplasma conjunctivae TaxID=45361 RepID=UPI003DA3FF41
MKAVHFGAGNIGRGLIARIYQQNNIEIIFVDVNPDLINNLNQQKTYKIIEITSNQEFPISNFHALHVNDENLIEHLKSANFVSTSIGVNNLAKLQPIFNKLSEVDTHLKQIICFENGFQISSLFAKMLKTNNFWTFVDVTVDQIIPNINKSSLDVIVENHYEIVLNDLDQQNKLDFVIYSKNLQYFAIRKFLLVNVLHSTLAYLGFRKGYKFIYETLQDSTILHFIDGLKEVLFSIVLKHSQNQNVDLESYFQTNISRFKNKELKDEITRVARNPVTKIGKNERFDILLQEAKKLHLDSNKLDIIYQCFANILDFNFSQDQQSFNMQRELDNDAYEFLKKHTNLEEYEIHKVLIMYKKEGKNDT